MQVDTPNGDRVPWKTISVTGPNVFWRQNQTLADHYPGTLILWMREDRGYQVLIGLRFSQVGIDQDLLKKLMTAAVGTVRIVTGVKIE